MRVRWILDDGPLDLLARVHENVRVESWTPGELIVAQKTADDAVTRRVDLLSRHVGGTPIIGRFDYEAAEGDPVHDNLQELRINYQSLLDLAEHQSIAWALTQKDEPVLVCQDKRAAFTALAELGRSRVAHPFDLWIHLLERRWIDETTFETLCRSTVLADQALPRLPQRVKTRLGPLARPDT